MKQERSLKGKRILIVDDEYLIAITIEESLREAGADVVIAATLTAAQQCATDPLLDVAVLDIRLGRQTTVTVADALAARGIPFLFYSGQVLPDAMRDKHPDVVLLMKPIPRQEFIDALSKLSEAATAASHGHIR